MLQWDLEITSFADKQTVAKKQRLSGLQLRKPYDFTDTKLAEFGKKRVRISTLDLEQNGFVSDPFNFFLKMLVSQFYVFKTH